MRAWVCALISSSLMAVCGWRRNTVAMSGTGNTGMAVAMASSSSLPSRLGGSRTSFRVQAAKVRPGAGGVRPHGNRRSEIDAGVAEAMPAPFQQEFCLMAEEPQKR